MEVLRHGREVVDELTLDREADAGAAHQDVENLVEGTHVIDGHETAIETGHFVAVERRTSGHEGAHGGHGAERADGLVDAVCGVQLGEACGEEVGVAGDSFLPSLTPVLVLQPPRITSKEQLAVSDFFDLSIYVDADEEDLERWYLERIFRLRNLAFSYPHAYFHQFASMPDDELEARGRDIWRRVNLPNLRDNIAPTRSRADIVLRKGPEHKISEVWLRKL